MLFIELSIDGVTDVEGSGKGSRLVLLYLDGHNLKSGGECRTDTNTGVGRTTSEDEIPGPPRRDPRPKIPEGELPYSYKGP